MWFQHPEHGWLFEQAGEQNKLMVSQRRVDNLFVDSDAFVCPCCGHPMKAMMLRDDSSPAWRHWRTRGHLHPRAGWVKTRPRPWIWQCRQCNQDQSGLTLWEWAGVLSSRGDVRAVRVAALAENLRAFKEVPKDVRQVRMQQESYALSHSPRPGEGDA